ncbi:MAG: hypothetical protein NUW01_02795 [Gemmatimonadaceae bacterium]|nr:hypothetical protein [Gemmatimonadaceae bacterium]
MDADVAAILKSLRWKADMMIVNHEGERVWLKQMPPGPGNPNGYITDCCLADFPCENHGPAAPLTPEEEAAA